MEISSPHRWLHWSTNLINQLVLTFVQFILWLYKFPKINQDDRSTKFVHKIQTEIVLKFQKDSSMRFPQMPLEFPSDELQWFCNPALPHPSESLEPFENLHDISNLFESGNGFIICHLLFSKYYKHWREWCRIFSPIFFEQSVLFSVDIFLFPNPCPIFVSSKFQTTTKKYDFNSWLFVYIFVKIRCVSPCRNQQTYW